MLIIDLESIKDVVNAAPTTGKRFYVKAPSGKVYAIFILDSAEGILYRCVVPEDRAIEETDPRLTSGIKVQKVTVA